MKINAENLNACKDIVLQLNIATAIKKKDTRMRHNRNITDNDRIILRKCGNFEISKMNINRSTSHP